MAGGGRSGQLWGGAGQRWEPWAWLNEFCFLIRVQVMSVYFLIIYSTRHLFYVFVLFLFTI